MLAATGKDDGLHVMRDTRRPLELTTLPRDLDGPGHALSW